MLFSHFSYKGTQCPLVGKTNKLWFKKQSMEKDGSPTWWMRYSPESCTEPLIIYARWKIMEKGGSEQVLSAINNKSGHCSIKWSQTHSCRNELKERPLVKCWIRTEAFRRKSGTELRKWGSSSFVNLVHPLLHFLNKCLKTKHLLLRFNGTCH